MNYLLALAAVLFLTLPYNAHASTYTARDAQGNVVRLWMDEKCSGPSWLALKKATFHYQGKDYEARWMAIGDAIVVFDSNGDVTPLPKSVFKKDVEV
jgi:hypothetical protein